MKIFIDKEEFFVPFDPEIIQLQDYINYQDQFGKALETRLEEVMETEWETEDDKIVEIDNLLDEEAICWISFWTKKDLRVIKGTKGSQQLVEAYKRKRYLLKHTEENFDLSKTYEWNGEEWKIQSFVIDSNSDMSFHEVIAAKETVRQVNKLKAGKLIAILHLAAIFFRHPDEAFDENFIKPGAQRIALMKTMPLSYAMGVSFFLRISVSFWTQILAYSNQQAV